MKKILLPIDFSSTSEATLVHATSLARDAGALLVIVHVNVPPMASLGSEGFVGSPLEQYEEVNRRLKSVVPADPDVDYEQKMLEGNPADEIVREADEEKADLIVMGTHGRTGLMRFLMGSVAEVVVRKANCPVLIYRQPLKEDEPKD